MFNDEIREALGLPALYEGLAEEAAEVAQAALKVARILRDENPTPVTLREAEENLSEELADFSIYLDTLQLTADGTVYARKMMRFISRIRKEAGGE